MAGGIERKTAEIRIVSIRENPCQRFGTRVTSNQESDAVTYTAPDSQANWFTAILEYFQVPNERVSLQNVNSNIVSVSFSLDPDERKYRESRITISYSADQFKQFTLEQVRRNGLIEIGSYQLNKIQINLDNKSVSFGYLVNDHSYVTTIFSDADIIHSRVTS